MENAKLVEVDGGWAFQGHHAFPSTMYKCKITYKGRDFHCAEQVYFHKMAEEAGDQRAATKLRECENGYEAKKFEYRNKKPDGWDNKKNDLLAKIQEKKFDQNENLKQKLIALIKGKIYEAMWDEYSGAGLTLAQKPLFGKTQQKGLNNFFFFKLAWQDTGKLEG